MVTTKADVARDPEATALPPLKPNQPNQSRAAPRSVMVKLWGGIGSPVTSSFSHHESGCKRGDAGTDVDHQPSCKIKGAEISDPSSHSPYPVGKGVVDKGGPQDEEDEVGFKLEPLGDRTRNESGRDHGKHHLKDHECLMGDGGRIIGKGIESYALQPDPLQASDDLPISGPKERL